MMEKKIISLLIFMLFISGFSIAGSLDLSDGISSYTDDPISRYDSLTLLKNSNLNIGFIVLYSKSKVYRGENKFISPSEISSGDYTGNINSVVLRPGSIVYGDIYIIDTSNSDKTQIISGNDIYRDNLGDDITVNGSASWSQIIGSLNNP